MSQFNSTKLSLRQKAKATNEFPLNVFTEFAVKKVKLKNDVRDRNVSALQRRHTRL